jgi:hypothetical protein
VFCRVDKAILSAVAYTPIEIRLYAEFAGLVDTADTDADFDDDMPLHDDDDEWTPDGGVRRVVWNAQFADHHWLVAQFDLMPS